MSDSRRSLDPPAGEMRRLGQMAWDGIVGHLTSLDEQPVAAPGAASELVPLVDEALPEEGRGVEDGLRFFFERVVPRMTRVNHPRFHAYIPCPSSFAGAIGEMLAAGTNPFVGSWLGGATLSALELTVLRWIAEIVGYPTDADGILTSGGSGANLVALAAARQHAGEAALARGCVYFSEEGHASLEKAAAVLGFPESALRVVPVDERYRMRSDVLDEMLERDIAGGRLPVLACANAGTINTGSIDPLAKVADVCAARGCWFHVDAAYGGPAAVTESGERALAGMERADSLTLDPHKWLYSPMGTGCVLVRRRGALESAFRARGEYLRDLPPDEVNFLDRSPELSRPARVLGVWMVLRSTGKNEIRRQVEADWSLAQLAAGLLAADPGLEIITPPELTIVAFRCRARDGESEDERAERDRRLMESILRDGTLMLSTTTIRGRSALRMVVMNHRTTEADVRRSVARIRELAA